MAIEDYPGAVDDPFSGPRADLGRRAEATDTIIIVVAVIAGLYFGHDVLVPIALAVLLSFVLAPMVGAFVRLRMGRVASVLLSVFLAFVVLGGVGAIIGKQLAQLAGNLPEYQNVITGKLQKLSASDFGKGLVEKASEAIHGLNVKIGNPEETTRGAAPADLGSNSSSDLLAVEVHQPAPGPIQILQSILSALLPPLATAAIVIVFVVFILLQREDLRDRFIGLIGAQDLHRTTKALDDAAARLSKYFLALTAINAVFGVGIAIGLALIGVPNPILWGIVGAVLRFVPYVGAFISAAFPLALAAAVDPGWSMVLETAGLFVVLETVMGQVVEPQLFGHTTGLSPLAIIVAAAFWTLIWGPAGLLLSTPVTACLVVLGRHVESLNFIELLLGDKPALSPVQSFYQRVLASDPDEVAFQAETLLKEMTLLAYYDDVAMPALALAQADVSRKVMDVERQVEVRETVEHVVDDLSDHYDEPAEAEEPGEEAEVVATPIDAAAVPARAALCIAGRTPLDQAASAILAQLLERSGLTVESAAPRTLTTNDDFSPKARGFDAICLIYLDHRRVAGVRYAVRRLRKRFPRTPIGVFVYGSPDLPAVTTAARADGVFGSLREAVEFCVSPAPVQEPVTPVRKAPAPRLAAAV